MMLSPIVGYRLYCCDQGVIRASVDFEGEISILFVRSHCSNVLMYFCRLVAGVCGFGC